jgi:hypothetical protein
MTVLSPATTHQRQEMLVGKQPLDLTASSLPPIDGSPVCVWRDEPIMGRLYQQLCPAREVRIRKPIGQPPWRSFVHWLGSMDCFWLVKLRRLEMSTPASRTAVRRTGCFYFILPWLSDDISTQNIYVIKCAHKKPTVFHFPPPNRRSSN